MKKNTLQDVENSSNYEIEDKQLVQQNKNIA